MAVSEETETVYSVSTGTSTSGVPQMLQRFENFDAETNARSVCDDLVARGWKASVKKAPLIRLVYKGTHHQVTLYLNTKNVQSSGIKEREFFRTLPGVEVHDTESSFCSYAYHDHPAGLDLTLSAAHALEGWADGKVFLK